MHCQIAKDIEAPESYELLPKLKLRFVHTACIYKHFMYVFGGLDGH